MNEYGERDYPEHAEYENGNYFNTCCKCGMQFIGLKNMPICKLCAEKDKRLMEAHPVYSIGVEQQGNNIRYALIESDIPVLVGVMKEKLHEKDSFKGLWDKETNDELFLLLNNEMEELAHAILEEGNEEIMREAADVANFAMMICANAKRRCQQLLF